MKQSPRFRTLGILLTMLLVFAALIPATAGAAGTEPIVRIGVNPQITEGTVGATGAFILTNKATGQVLYTGAAGQSIPVKLGSTAIVRTNYRLQVSFSADRSKVDALVAKATALGYVVYLEPYNNGWRVYLGEFPSNASFGVRNTFRNKAIADGVAMSDSFWKLITITDGQASIELTLPTGAVTVNAPVTVAAQDGLITLNGRMYRGTGEVRFNSQGTLALINELPMEQYLYGVVPRELPPNPYGELEAQKSQAVAARTYAMANLGKRKADGYDLLPTTSDQVYGGYQDEHPVSNAAVDGTRGMVLKYDGKYVDAVFFSTSGGFTANNEEVWNSAPVAYLRGIPDAQRGNALEHVPSLEVFKRHANPTSLRNAAEGDFESDWSKYHRWTVEWTQAELQAILGAWFNTELGTIHALNIPDRGPSGRALTLEVVADAGTFYVYKDTIRSALKYVLADGSYTSLRSTLVYLEPVVDPKTKEITGFVGYGGGWGHGVGLSQTGAVGMAEKKATYQEILAHFYQGSILEQAY
ncbi:MAG: SpoIID/LytB domain protein [Symbiobacteriaceae bacterium]|jgi:stage II sporulation protein D|nr:SpoIID/LytB domain protein [Symbiobacteriaceae bacterium]